MPLKKKSSKLHTPSSNLKKSSSPKVQTSISNLKKSGTPEAQTPLNDDEKPLGPKEREPMSHFVPRHDKTIFIQLSHSKINEIAYSISQQPLTWDELNWLISETELKIANAIVSDENPLKGANPNQVKIDRTRIIENPDEGSIRELAQNIANKQESIEQRYLDLALRQYIFKLAK